MTGIQIVGAVAFAAVVAVTTYALVTSGPREFVRLMSGTEKKED